MNARVIICHIKISHVWGDTGGLVAFDIVGYCLYDGFDNYIKMVGE